MGFTINVWLFQGLQNIKSLGNPGVALEDSAPALKCDGYKFESSLAGCLRTGVGGPICDYTGECARAANSNSKELDLFAELKLELELETQNFVGLEFELQLENI